MSDNILDSAKTESTETVVETTAPAKSDTDLLSALEQLVGDNKKFKDEEALAKSKLEADQYIDQLKSELKDLREYIDQKDNDRKQNETAEQLAALRKEISQRPDNKESKENTTPALAESDLETLIDKHITERETKRSASANVDETNSALLAYFGDQDKAVQAVKDRAEVLGLSVSEIKTTAAKSPKAALHLLGIDTESRHVADIDKQSSVTTPEAGVNGNQRLDKAYFDNLRRTDIMKYFDPKVQNKIFELKKQGKYN